jgi:NodT family efflux transporter outer membrane factor (OMF) lipoprotein
LQIGPWLVALVQAGWLWGCATEETLPVAEPPVPGAYRNQVPDALLPRPTTEWWREFASAELDRLQEAALANNAELKVAIARVAQAQAQARIAGAALAPSLDAFAKREGLAPTQGAGTAETRSEWRSLNRYQVGLRANYEVDLWGKNEYAAESALALAEASLHHRETVALTLTADVAAAYVEYLSLSERFAIGERNLRSRRSSVAAMDKRVRSGDATAFDAAQQRVATATAESAAAALAQRRERSFNRLAVLTGAPPAQLKLETRSLEEIAIPPINPGLPSELLCRRPDIRRAEAQLAAAQFDVRSLRANLLPSFSLVAEVGYGSRHLAALAANPVNLVYLAAATLTQSVLDSGRRESQLEAAKARHLELLHQYSGTLLTALREVEDALAGVRLTEEQRRALAEALETSRASFAANRRSFEIGAVDFVALLDAEQKLIAGEDALASALYDRMRAAIDLFRSLGGGTRIAERDPCAQ